MRRVLAGHELLGCGSIIKVLAIGKEGQVLGVPNNLDAAATCDEGSVAGAVAIAAKAAPVLSGGGA